MQRALVLGSGLTAAPLIEYLTRNGTISVTIASRRLERSTWLAAKYKNTTAVSQDLTSEHTAGKLISEHDIVICNVPFEYHPMVAKQCVNHKVNMVGTVYVTPELQVNNVADEKHRELHESACDVGITLMNEMGLDPGIDHMLAMKCIDDVHRKGGKAESQNNQSQSLRLKTSTVNLAAMWTGAIVPCIGNLPGQTIQLFNITYKTGFSPMAFFSCCLFSSWLLFNVTQICLKNDQSPHCDPSSV